jgi:D-alanyl-lipoteichoic acid acyltransferase DltB (MBOAT superfamily)
MARQRNSSTRYNGQPPVILPLQQLLTVLAILLAIYWLIPARWQSARLIMVIAASLSVLFILSPVVAATAALAGALVGGIGLALRYGAISGACGKKASWLSFAVLLVPEFFGSAELTQSMMGAAVDPQSIVSQIAWLGLGLLVIRVFVAVRDLASSNGGNILATLCGVLFFASYPGGPVVRAKHFDGAAGTLTVETVLDAMARFGWGAAMVNVIAPCIRMQDVPTVNVFCDAWVNAYQHFIALFVNFAGATHVAIAIGLLFGFALPENFRAPLFATSVADFWGRWHMSFMDIIRTYFTAPIVRWTGNRKLALLIVFPLIGLWHHFSSQYFLWGVGHALALIVYAQMQQSVQFTRLRVEYKVPLGILGWAFTISYVSALSSIANAPSWVAAQAIMLALLTGG